MRRLTCLILAISLSACASTTVIDSVPSGATLYLNGAKVGVTPYTHTDTKVIGDINTVLLKKEGYQDYSTAFSRTEKANMRAIAGFFVLVPLLWAMDYQPNHTYEMMTLKPR